MWAYRLRCLIDPEFAKWPETLRGKHIRKRGALLVLRSIGPPAKEALPALRRLARLSPTFENWGTRVFALSAIECIGPEQRDAPLFIRALKDEQWILRMEGLRGLGKIDKPAPQSIDALNNALLDKDERVRKLAHEVLQRIDPQSVSDLNSQQSK